MRPRFVGRGDRASVDRRSVLATIAGTAALGTVPLDTTGAGSEGATGPNRRTVGEEYAVVQGDRCVPVVPLSGDASVEELYDLQIPERYTGDNGATDSGGPYYQSNGTTDLQRQNTTITFLYDGPDGLSLVTVHDTETDAPDSGGAVSWTLEDVPADATWAVKDDLYLDPDTGEQVDNNYDRWALDGTTHRIDWTWGSAGTDGGALGPLGDGFDVAVDPAFNDRAELWGDHYAEDPITDWQVLSFPNGREDPKRTSLALDRPVAVRAGACETGSDRDDTRSRIEIGIDVRPGSDRNPINPRAPAPVPVLLISGDEFDPTTVDAESLRFGPPDIVDGGGGAEPIHGGFPGAIGDGRGVVFLFLADEAGFEDGDGTAKVVGATDDGTSLFGTDSVMIVGFGRDDDDDDDDGFGDDGDEDDWFESDDEDDEDNDGDDGDGDDEDEDDDDDDDDEDRGRGNGPGGGNGSGRGEGRGNGDRGRGNDGRGRGKGSRGRGNGGRGRGNGGRGRGNGG